MGVAKTLKSITRDFCDRSGVWASRAYLGATAILGVKNVLPALSEGRMSQDAICDTIGMLLFFGSSLCYPKVKDDPRYLQLAGLCTIFASSAVAAGQWNGDWSDPKFLTHAGSMVPTFLGGLMFLFNKPGFGALPELASRPLHFIAGVQQKDPGQMLFAVLCMIGDSGVAMLDPRIKNFVKEKILGEQAPAAQIP
ncbi:MAG TPA: hypothetical protein PKX38_00825 [Alphaproteobacteria bacterium]|jgi:hypothetical protein|nr:hypothetical protein [Micavibrio sp.]MBK9562561.1 hypothetical protein [Micavibrio sp.]HQX26460.1 hypothetical protein [Alphaproteobacteria bacterium]